MKRKLFIFIGLLLLLAGCKSPSTNQPSSKPVEHGNMHSEDSMGMDHENMEGMQGHMDHDDIPPLQASKGIKELTIPPLLEKKQDADYDYEVVAQEGITEFFEDGATKTYGYNGDLLGPTMRLKKGETVKVKVRNELKEPTTFHWHGLEVPGSEDGGPSKVIQPGETKMVTLKADQPAATLWYHPHPHELTAKQVFKGLAGMLYVTDTDEDATALPHTYGVDDIPLIFQDRLFDGEQLNYDGLMNNDGTIGDISIVNGTMNPKLTITQPIMRFRILNGANARNYTFRLSNAGTITQIASDGGLLSEPIETEEITLSPSERAEILIDFSKMDPHEPIAITDEAGNALLPFEWKIDESTEKLDAAAWTDNTPFLSEEEKSLPVSKEIELFGMMDKVTINGKKFDPNRIDFRQEKGVSEVWEIYNKPDMMGGMIHPFHIHGTQFKIISRDGKEPEPHERGWKDSVLIEPDERVKLLVTFPEEGIYMYHCHILEHEDNGMMGQVEVY